jgi:hypothetical protein
MRGSLTTVARNWHQAIESLRRARQTIEFLKETAPSAAHTLAAQEALAQVDGALSSSQPVLEELWNQASLYSQSGE